MYELFNALDGDDIVLTKQIECYLDDGKTCKRTTFPVGTAFKVVRGHRQVQIVSRGMLAFIATDKGVLLHDRGEDYQATEKVLNASLVVKRDRKGKPVVRSKVRHGEFWQKAAPGAVVATYVFADVNGKRFVWNGMTVDQSQLYNDFAIADQVRYFEEYVANPTGLHRGYEAPPYKVNGAFVSEAQAEKIIRQNWSGSTYGMSVQYEYKEHKKFPDIGRAKQRALYLVGYYNQFGNEMGMLNNWWAMPPWGEDWYIWSADADGCLIDKVENCAQYVTRTQAYAALSDKFGADVKEVFKKIEKAATPFHGVVVWSKFDNTDIYNDDRFERSGYVDHDGQLIGKWAGFQIKKPLVDEVKKLVGKGEIKKFGKTALVVATEHVGDALQLRLTYRGKLDMRVIDLQTMQET